MAIQALLANEIRVVQSSMLGSIFSNLLLVLGGCFFFGGIRHQQQEFNATAATANMGLLALSGIALVLPTPFANYYATHDEHVLLISRFAAIFLLFMYLQLLVFQLHTHANVFAAEGEGTGELANISFGLAVLGLLVTTLLVTIFSEFLVDSIDGFTAASGISRTFVGIVLLPIVGNAVEHVTAITVAQKDKMDLAMGIGEFCCLSLEDKQCHASVRPKQTLTDAFLVSLNQSIHSRGKLHSDFSLCRPLDGPRGMGRGP